MSKFGKGRESDFSAPAENQQENPNFHLNIEQLETPKKQDVH